MNIDFGAVLITIIAIVVGITGGKWLSNKFENWNTPKPVSESEAAEIVQTQPRSLEEWMDAWPNV